MELNSERSRGSNFLSSLQDQLMVMGINDKDTIEQSEGGIIQHKLGISKANIINWTKVRDMILFLLIERNGECYYELTIYHDDSLCENEQYTKIFQTLKSTVESLDASIDIIKYGHGIFGMNWEFLIRKQMNNNSDMNCTLTSLHSCRNEIKIGLFGEESTGKSTALSVILHGKLDDGIGSARKTVFRFQHEIISGKTLSISHQILGIDHNGLRIDGSREEILSKSYKIVNLYDVGGSEKALKTTLSLFSPDYIDYCLLFVSASQGVTDAAKMFLLLGSSMNIPIISVVTMIDLVSKEYLEEFLKMYKAMIKSCKIQRVPMIMHSYEDVALFSRNINENVHPILAISNRTGDGIENLNNLLQMMPNPKELIMPMVNSPYLHASTPGASCQFDIHEHFLVEGMTILGGVVSRGRIISGCKYYLGPNKNGNFRLMKVESIHCKKFASSVAFEGQFSSIGLAQTNGCDDVRKGMCLLDMNEPPKACRLFKAEVWSIESGVKRIKYKYEPVVIINHIRQCCKIKREKSFYGELGDKNGYEDQLSLSSMYSKSTSLHTEYEEYEDSIRSAKPFVKKEDDDFVISSDQKIELIFEFKNFPEYITVGSNLIINDNNLKAIGIITGIIYK